MWKKSTVLRLGLSLKPSNWDLGISTITRTNVVESPLCTKGRGSVLDWWLYCISRNVQLTEGNTDSYHCWGTHPLFILGSHYKSSSFEPRLHKRFLKTDPHQWPHGQWSIMPQGWVLRYHYCREVYGLGACKSTLRQSRKGALDHLICLTPPHLPQSCMVRPLELSGATLKSKTSFPTLPKDLERDDCYTCYSLVRF